MASQEYKHKCLEMLIAAGADVNKAMQVRPWVVARGLRLFSPCDKRMAHERTKRKNANERKEKTRKQKKRKEKKRGEVHMKNTWGRRHGGGEA